MAWLDTIKSFGKKKDEPKTEGSKDTEDIGVLTSIYKRLNEPVFQEKTAEKPKTEAKPSQEAAKAPAPEAETAEAKGMMSSFYRRWKDPAFLKQLKTLATHMQRAGVDVKDKNAVQAWIEKNKKDIEAGKFNKAPEGEKVKTYEKTGPDVGRNDPCPCGSKKKYKKCCANK